MKGRSACPWPRRLLGACAEAREVVTRVLRGDGNACSRMPSCSARFVSRFCRACMRVFTVPCRGFPPRPQAESEWESEWRESEWESEWRESSHGLGRAKTNQTRTHEHTRAKRS